MKKRKITMRESEIHHKLGIDSNLILMIMMYDFYFRPSRDVLLPIDGNCSSINEESLLIEDNPPKFSKDICDKCKIIFRSNKIVIISDNQLNIWDPNTNKSILTIYDDLNKLRNIEEIYYIDIMAIIVYSDRSMEIWDMETKTYKTYTFKENFRFLASKDQILIITTNKYQFWDINMTKCTVIEKDTQNLLKVLLYPNDKMVIARAGCYLEIYDIKKGTQEFLQASSIDLLSTVINYNDTKIIAVTNTNHIKIWDINTQLITELDCTGKILYLSILPDNRIFTASSSSILQIWDIDTNNCDYKYDIKHTVDNMVVLKNGNVIMRDNQRKYFLLY